MTQGRRKILFLVTKSGSGGAQRYVHDLATLLPRDRFEPVVAFGPAPDSDRPGILANRLAAAGIRTLFVPALSRDVGSADWQALREIVALLWQEQPAIAHLNSSKAAGLGVLAARLVGVPCIVFTVHGWPFTEDRSFLWRAATWLFSWLSAILCHTVICVSEADLRRARAMPFIAHKAQLVHNGIAPAALLSREEARAALVAPADLHAHAHDLWVISTGELTANKGYHAAIEALATYARNDGRPLFYCIAGDGEDRTAIERHLATARLQNHVRLLGFVPGMEHYLAAFDIFFMPSRKEGLPYVLLEAGMAGLPVVASDVGGIPEIIRHGETGLLCPSGGISAYAKALESLSRDTAHRQHLGSALKEDIAQRFSQEQMLRETIAVYQ